MSRLRLIFAGSGEFGLPTLRRLADLHDILQVVSQPDRPAGRGRKLAPTPISRFAIDRNLPLIRTADINAEMLPTADAMIVIAFGQKIGQAIVDQPRLGSVNLHSSRLPAFRGAAPINWAIIRGESATGNSVIRLADRMDAGAILGQSELPIGASETAGELHDRLAADGVQLMTRVLDDLAAGRATETPQAEARATAAPKLNRESTRIDWSGSSQQIANQIRGMSPWPGCRVRLLDTCGGPQSRMTLVRAVPNGCEGQRWEPGEIMMEGCIQCGEGELRILEVQPEGKRPMPLEAYQRGNPWSPGMRLESVVQ